MCIYGMARSVRTMPKYAGVILLALEKGKTVDVIACFLDFVGLSWFIVKSLDLILSTALILLHNSTFSNVDADTNRIFLGFLAAVFLLLANRVVNCRN